MADVFDDVFAQIGSQNEPATDQTTQAPETDVTPEAPETDVTTEPQTDVTTQTPETDVTTTAPETDVTTVAPDFSSIDFSSLEPEHQLRFFNQLTGLDLKSVDDIRQFSGEYNKLPDYRKNNDLVPKLVDKLKQSKNTLSLFPDETAYKVTQAVIKNPDYQGKETILRHVMSGDVKAMTNLQVLRASSELNMPPEVSNPLKATLRSLGVSDVDTALTNYDALEEDDKDIIAMAASKERKILATIGSDIELPKDDIDILGEIESERTRAEEDLATRRSQIQPIAESLVKDFKELNVDSDYKFQLELSADDLKEYSEFVVDAVVSGEYDLQTEAGRQELWDAVEDLVWMDKGKRQQIIKAMRGYERGNAEKEARAKYDNAKPLDGKERPDDPGKKQQGNPVVDVINEMVNEMR